MAPPMKTRAKRPVRKFHIVGAGLVGHKRAKACSQMGQVESVFDSDLYRAHSLAHKFNAAAPANFSNFLSHVEPGDFVVVSVHNSFLAEIGAQVVSKGANVLLEKPGGTASSQLRELATLCEELGVVGRVGYNHRFHPALRALKGYVESKSLGNVINLRARYGHGGRPGYEKEWRFDPSRSGGGELLDQGAHLVDLTRFLLGDLSINAAQISNVYWGGIVEDNATLLATSHGGSPVALHASWTEWKNLFSIEVFFQEGKVEVQGLGRSYGIEKLILHTMGPISRKPSRSIRRFAGRVDWSWFLEVEDWVGESIGADSSGAGIEDGIGTLELIETAYQIAGR